MNDVTNTNLANDLGNVIADYVGFTVMKMQPVLFKFKDINGYLMGYLINFANNASVQICFISHSFFSLGLFQFFNVFCVFIFLQTHSSHVYIHLYSHQRKFWRNYHAYNDAIEDVVETHHCDASAIEQLVILFPKIAFVVQ